MELIVNDIEMRFYDNCVYFVEFVDKNKTVINEYLKFKYGLEVDVIVKKLIDVLYLIEKVVVILGR